MKGRNDSSQVSTVESHQIDSALRKLMKNLGYFVNENGICNGLTHMWLQAKLVGQDENYYRRLSQLSFLDQTGNIADYILKTREKVKQKQELSKTERGWLDLAALCEGIMLYQSPTYSLSKDVLMELGQKDITQIAKVTASAALESKGGVHEVFNLENTNLDETQWQLYFEKLSQVLKRQQANYGIVISTLNHKMGLEYIKERNVWRLFDSNQMPYKDLIPEDMGKQMMAIFTAHKTDNRIMTRIYTTQDQLALFPGFTEALHNFKTGKPDTEIPLQQQETITLTTQQIENMALYMKCGLDKGQVGYFDDKPNKTYILFDNDIDFEAAKKKIDAQPGLGRTAYRIAGLDRTIEIYDAIKAIITPGVLPASPPKRRTSSDEPPSRPIKRVPQSPLAKPSPEPAPGKFTLIFKSPSLNIPIQLTGDSLEQLTRDLLVNRIAGLKMAGKDAGGTITISGRDSDFDHQSQYSYIRVNDNQSGYLLEYNDGGNYLLNKQFENACIAIMTKSPAFQADSAKPFGQYNFDSLSHFDRDSVVITMLRSAYTNETVDMLRNQTSAFLHDSSDYLTRNYSQDPNFEMVIDLYYQVQNERKNLNAELNGVGTSITEKLQNAGWLNQDKKDNKKAPVDDAILTMLSGIDIIRNGIKHGEIHRVDDIKVKLLPLIESAISIAKQNKSHLPLFHSAQKKVLDNLEEIRNLIDGKAQVPRHR